MIRVSANTAEEIAQSLRGQRREVSDAQRAAEVAAKLLGKKEKSKGMIIEAPHRSGKTVELLRYAEEKYPNGQYAIVCPSQRMQEHILTTRYSLLEWRESVIPLMLTPDNIMSMSGQIKPIFCDEWDLLPENTHKIIIDSGLFVAAVTS